jgi:hypothetical protein
MRYLGITNDVCKRRKIMHCGLTVRLVARTSLIFAKTNLLVDYANEMLVSLSRRRWTLICD